MKISYLMTSFLFFLTQGKDKAKMASQLTISADILSTLPSEDESEVASLPPFQPFSLSATASK